MRTITKPIGGLFNLIFKPIRTMRKIQQILVMGLIIFAVFTATALLRPDLVRWTCPLLHTVLPTNICTPGYTPPATTQASTPTQSPSSPAIHVTTPTVIYLIITILCALPVWKSLKAILQTAAPYHALAALTCLIFFLLS